MRKLAPALVAILLTALLVLTLWPSVSFTEDRDTVLLARTIYTLAGRESYETKLAIGTVVMNRVEDGWFPADLGDVLRDQMQFPAGGRYDAESLRAAHAVLGGKRTLSRDVCYYQRADAAEPWGEAWRTDRVGGYNFYVRSGEI